MHDSTVHEDTRVVLVPHWVMVECEGDARDAMVLAQITWWMQPAQRDGSPRTTHLAERGGHLWMYQTDAEMAEQIGMSPDQVYRARRALMRRGLLISKSATIKGGKVTLLRPLPSTLDHSAESRNTTLDHSAESPQPFRDLAESHARDSSSLKHEETHASAADAAHAGLHDLEGLTEDDPDYGFANWWAAYPQRRGRKVGKAAAMGKWRRLSLAHRREVYAATLIYRVEIGEFAKDPERFITKEFWKDWMTPRQTTVTRTAADVGAPNRGMGDLGLAQ